jgi:hypothetical protein
MLQFWQSQQDKEDSGTTAEGNFRGIEQLLGIAQKKELESKRGFIFQM